MAVLTGKSGTITFASGYAAHCNSWTVEIATDIFEDTALGDSWRTRVVGINNWTGSYDCALDESVLSDDISYMGIGESITVAAEAHFKYAGATGVIAGSIIITGATLNASTSGVNTISCTFEGSDAPSFD